MYDNRVTEALLYYIIKEVGLRYTIIVEGIYGIAYNDSKSKLRLYITEDDVNTQISCFALESRDDIDAVLGDTFFSKKIGAKFKTISDVLSDYYVGCEGVLPLSYLKVKLLSAMQGDCVDADYLYILNTVGMRINKQLNSVWLYKVYNSRGSVKVLRRDFIGLDSVYIVLGCDFMGLSSDLKMERAEDYFYNLN